MSHLAKLGDLAAIDYGYTAKASFEVEGPKFLRITDLTSEGVDWNTVPQCPIADDDLAKHRLHKDDIVFARTGATTGKSYLIKDPPTAVAASYLIRLRLADPRCNPEYVAYFFQTSGYWATIQKGISGSAQGGFNATKLKQLQIPTPPKAEQKRIVAILDEAFGAIDRAKEIANSHLLNIDELVRSVYREAYTGKLTASEKKLPVELPKEVKSTARGRAASDRKIMGEYALSVGEVDVPAPAGWTWVSLGSVARLESGHTPSRRKPEYWGGDVPWIGIKDAREYHGRQISNTQQYTNELGLANSAARLLPAGTVCLSRTASVGYVVVMGKEMATSQDFVNWVCSDVLEPEFLKHLLIAEKPAYRKFSSGAVHQTIYFPEVKAFHICIPHISEQRKIVSLIDAALTKTSRVRVLQEQKIAALDELKQSILQKAFTGQLTAKSPELEAVP